MQWTIVPQELQVEETVTHLTQEYIASHLLSELRDSELVMWFVDNHYAC